jgi:RNase P/RNase MRP subunit POP5
MCETMTGVNALAAIQKRQAELFGSIALERAALRLIKDENRVAIMRCSLAEVERVLATIALCDPPIVTLDMSSSTKRLKRRLQV